MTGDLSFSLKDIAISGVDVALRIIDIIVRGFAFIVDVWSSNQLNSERLILS